MGLFEIKWKKSAVKELKKLPQKDIFRVLQAIEKLSSEPYPRASKKLTGSEHTYKIRVRVYRVIYSVYEKSFVIEVIRIRHRKDAYRI